MSDELARRKAIDALSRADEAKAILDSPLYIEAITAMKAAMFMQFEDTKLDDTEARHELWQRMQLMKLFTGKFEHIVRQGDKAKTTLSLLERSLEAVGFR